jgi:hypothetical protein
MHCGLTVRDKMLSILSKGVPYSYTVLCNTINANDMYPDTTIQELREIVEALITEGLLYEIEQIDSMQMMGGDQVGNPNKYRPNQG